MAKVHIYNRSEIVNSVLGGQSVAALCGLSKTLTRQTVDDAAKSKPVCKACALAIAELGKREGATIHAALGWVKLLEDETAARLARPAFRLTSSRVWGFPLAG